MNSSKETAGEIKVLHRRPWSMGNVRAEEGDFLKTDLRSHHEEIINDRLIFLPSFREVVENVLDKQINKENLKNVLEVGCGTGFFSRYLAPSWLKERLVGFDINPLSLKTLKEKDDLDVFQGSIYSLPIKSESIDAVIGYSSFDSLIWLHQALNEAKRVLKPGGKLILFQDLTTETYETDGTPGDKEASFERYHKELVKKTRKRRIKILEGEESYLIAANTEHLSDVRSRVPDLELPDWFSPLAVIWDRGWCPVLTKHEREQQGISKEKMSKALVGLSKQLWKKGIEHGILQNFNTRAGNLISIVIMRCLVAQKG